VERNPDLEKTAGTGAMPYGGEQADHDLLKSITIKPYLFEKTAGTVQMVYAGAMLPKAYGPLEAIFKSICEQPAMFRNVEFHFIGTGKTTNDPEGYNIKPLAEKYGLWQTNIYEYPRRIPYLDVLVHLQISDGIFILGSTEPHYTPSKAYQGVLSGKPILAVLHTQSTAVKMVRESGAGVVLDFNGESRVRMIENSFAQVFQDYLLFEKQFDPSKINSSLFEQYSAKSVTAQLTHLLDEALIIEN